MRDDAAQARLSRILTDRDRAVERDSLLVAFLWLAVVLIIVIMPSFLPDAR